MPLIDGKLATPAAKRRINHATIEPQSYMSRTDGCVAPPHNDCKNLTLEISTSVPYPLHVTAVATRGQVIIQPHSHIAVFAEPLGLLYRPTRKTELTDYYRSSPITNGL